LTYTEKIAYLRAERLRLDEQRRGLLQEFELLLRRAHFSRREWAAHRQRMAEYRNLEANHRIAVKWTLSPPCGRIDSSPLHRSDSVAAPKRQWKPSRSNVKGRTDASVEIFGDIRTAVARR
jgi:hypothetical protein